MIYALWRRYRSGPRWWLAVLCAVVLADVLVALFIGDRIVRWEINYIKESWNGQ